MSRDGTWCLVDVENTSCLRQVHGNPTYVQLSSLILSITFIFLSCIFFLSFYRFTRTGRTLQSLLKMSYCAVSTLSGSCCTCVHVNLCRWQYCTVLNVNPLFCRHSFLLISFVPSYRTPPLLPFCPRCLKTHYTHIRIHTHKHTHTHTHIHTRKHTYTHTFPWLIPSLHFSPPPTHAHRSIASRWSDSRYRVRWRNFESMGH